jgi:7,8-dihydropterin-6-yl-methyl-4-(beta-D-ribofuranosyl)aminobenzene 5'-phosphate synthase
MSSNHAARGKSRAVLFDTGPEDYAFERNVTRLAVDLSVVESIVLSHGHWDHSGAMLLALSMIRSRYGGVRQPNGAIRRMEDVPSVLDLTAFGAKVKVTTEPQLLAQGA